MITEEIKDILNKYGIIDIINVNKTTLLRYYAMDRVKEIKINYTKKQIENYMKKQGLSYIDNVFNKDIKIVFTTDDSIELLEMRDIEIK